MRNIALAHDVIGRGRQSLLLVHGAYSSRRVYNEQIRHFSQSHRIIAADLRGHGESEKPQSGYSIPQLASDVAGLLDRLDTTGVDAVGHSIGGAVVLELAAQNPELVRAVATLDSPSIIPGWAESHKTSYMADLKEPHFRQTIREYLDVAASPISNHPIRKQELEEFHSTPDHVAAAIWDMTSGWDPAGVLRSVKQPLLYVDHGQPDLDYAALRSHCPQVVTGQTVGAGHRALQEVPDQVNSMLERFFTHAERLAAYAREYGGSFRYRRPQTDHRPGS